MIKELAREVQELRKKNKFNVNESIMLTLKSDDVTSDILEKNASHLMSEVEQRK